jgi:hypothetical protein
MSDLEVINIDGINFAVNFTTEKGFYSHDSYDPPELKIESIFGDPGYVSVIRDYGLENFKEIIYHILIDRLT